ncbi:uncharacterized protein B0416.5-like, partial [Saccoglossus kowalevskii]|uniref:Uncharacterized protein B0416.5-like n=1 Tax=Saccoglossus kowalevskii TaxID=10224 RepID=A0ABM0LUI5_SACKO
IVLGVQNAVGIVGGVAASIFTDRTRLFEETAKVTLALSSVFTSLMMVTSCIPHQEVLIVIFFMCQGIVSSASYPVTVELMIETSYPVAEATSLGLSLIVMHVQAIIFTFVLESLSRPMTEYERIHQKCISAHHNPSYNNTQPKDMTVAMLFYAGLSALQAIGIIIFFKSENRRIKKEKIEKIIVNNQCSMNEDKPLNI